jgi:hypothetical protein
MQITKDEIMDYWLGKFHNTSCKELIEKHPEEIKSPKWFDLFPVTQEQHDEWYDWAIALIAKRTRMSKKYAQKAFVFEYLNTAPNIKEDEKQIS